eukprot:TRINITY_DN23574_c0_g1_i1.p1 TRINITY_DN23574_c0_g1~~TRINITY_DN23574_c0_g1_i1.p1  ORF type:complete len:176 (-),score=31.30 TRINITY_DN23574_c0_g1_i1:49-576(-)
MGARHEQAPPEGRGAAAAGRDTAAGGIPRLLRCPESEAASPLSPDWPALEVVLGGTCFHPLPPESRPWHPLQPRFLGNNGERGRTAAPRHLRASFTERGPLRLLTPEGGGRGPTLLPSSPCSHTPGPTPWLPLRCIQRLAHQQLQAVNEVQAMPWCWQVARSPPEKSGCLTVLLY